MGAHDFGKIVESESYLSNQRLLRFLYFEWVIPSKVTDLFLMFGGQSNGSIWNATLHITWVICREQNDSSMSECLLACFWLHPHFFGL